MKTKQGADRGGKKQSKCENEQVILSCVSNKRRDVAAVGWECVSKGETEGKEQFETLEAVSLHPEARCVLVQTGT